MFKKTALIIGLSLLSTGGFAEDFELTSSEIKPGATLTNAQVFKGFGCDGDNISPQLSWSAGPEGTKSYALTVYDPDAPTGSGWWHWVVYNIPGDVTSLDAGVGTADGEQLPEGAEQGRTDFGSKGFGGACPPPGDEPHRYIFTVHALKTEKINVPSDATAALIGFMINANRLDQTSFTAYYGR